MSLRHIEGAECGVAESDAVGRRASEASEEAPYTRVGKTEDRSEDPRRQYNGNEEYGRCAFKIKKAPADVGPGVAVSGDDLDLRPGASLRCHGSSLVDASARRNPSGKIFPRLQTGIG